MGICGDLVKGYNGRQNIEAVANYFVYFVYIYEMLHYILMPDSHENSDD